MESGMRDSDRLRDRAATLLGLAAEARKECRFYFAAEIAKVAADTRDQAAEMDQRELQVQQQQQQQPQQQPRKKTEDNAELHQGKRPAVYPPEPSFD